MYMCVCLSLCVVFINVFVSIKGKDHIKQIPIYQIISFLEFHDEIGNSVP